MATITVTGTYEDSSGTPLSGTVSFTPVATGTDGVAVFLEDPVTAKVTGGVLSKVVTTTDTWDVDGAVTYRVVERVGSTGRSKFYAQILSSMGASVDITDLQRYANPPNQIQIDSGAPVDFTSHLTTDHQPILDELADHETRIDDLEAATLPDFYQLPVDGIPQADLDAATEAKLDGAIQKSIVDAKGDIIAATAADTVTRLALGTNGHVLTADSAQAAGVKWAALPSAPDLTPYATKAGSVNQFADVSDASPADGNVLKYNSGVSAYTPQDLSGLYAGIDSSGRLASTNYPLNYRGILVINEGDTVPTSTPAGTIILSRPPAASLIPTLVGETASTTGNPTSIVVTLTQALAIGDYAIVAIMTSGEDTSPTPGGMPQTFTLTFGGTGAGAASGGWVNGIGSYRSGTVQCDIYYARLTTAASSGSTITISCTDSRVNFAAKVVQGINLAQNATTSANEDAAEATNNWASTSSLTRTLGPSLSPNAQNNTISFMAVGYNASTGASARSTSGNNGWTALGSQLVADNASGSRRAVDLYYLVNTVAGTVTGSFTFTAADGTTGSHSAGLISLKAA